MYRATDISCCIAFNNNDTIIFIVNKEYYSQLIVTIFFVLIYLLIAEKNYFIFAINTGRIIFLYFTPPTKPNKQMGLLLHYFVCLIIFYVNMDRRNPCEYL